MRVASLWLGEMLKDPSMDSEEVAMRTNARITLAALVAAATLAGCETSPPYASNAEAIDDATITANVKAALTQDPETRASNISVNTIRGTVELTGFVAVPAQLDEAARDAGSVAGVRSVDNELRVSDAGPAGGPVVGSTLDDRTISYNVRAALAANPETASSQIKVTTANGVVQLAGFVASNEQRAAAGTVASSVQGVRGVDNDLRLAD
jgi:hyperosmotically inducible periplasmic protein